jgi:hypothetical protein
VSGPASPEAEARLALEKIDEVLAKKPEKDDYALTAATQKLCIWRDAMAPAARGGGAVERNRLERVNAVLSVVVGMHFPAGPLPWDALAGARSWLADLLAEASPAS